MWYSRFTSDQTPWAGMLLGGANYCQCDAIQHQFGEDCCTTNLRYPMHDSPPLLPGLADLCLSRLDAAGQKRMGQAPCQAP
jgi:hypothetical protein